jgi:hypothetical protein
MFWGAGGPLYKTGTYTNAWDDVIQGNRYPSDGVNIGSAVGNYWQFTGVQMEVSPSVTDFEYTPYTQELLECQRFYYRWTQPTNASTSFIGSANSINEIWWNMFYPTTMRVPPSVTNNIVGSSSSVSPTANQIGFYQGGFKSHTGFGSVGAFGINNNITLMRLYASYSGISIGTSGTLDFGGGCIIEFNSEI